MDTAFLQDRLAVTKALIIAYEDAFLAFAGGAQSYTLDTGQSRQTVTKADLVGMHTIIESLYNRCATMEARLTGSGSLTMIPIW